MSARILDGRALAANIHARIKAEVDRHRSEGRQVPGLAVIRVGEDAASKVYVAHKQKACEIVGFYSEVKVLKATVGTQGLIEHIHQYNQNPLIHGILVQLPLPPSIEPTVIVEHIDPTKDVDGFHPYNLGRLVLRQPLLRPCTPKGIMSLLAYTKQPIKGRHAVIISASNIVGRPMALELLMAGATVTVCHRFTNDLAHHVAQADILVTAIGKPGIVKSEWIKPEAIVVDVAIFRKPDGSLVGDLDFETARQKARWITPVPGGVGPMTVASLLENTLAAFSDSFP